MAAVAASAAQEVIIVDSDDEGPQHASRAGSSRSARPPQPLAVPAGRPAQQQRRPAAAAAAAGASRGGGGGSEIIDLTSDWPPAAAAAPASGDLQIVRSTVARVPMRGVKRPRPPAPAPQLSPVKQMLLQQLRNPPPPPPPPPEPEGPKCGICLEPMGGSHERQMASGSCGHVYCYDCLVEAVRAQKKCPTCRKGMQVRQIHKVFLSFT